MGICFTSLNQNGTNILAEKECYIRHENNVQSKGKLSMKEKAPFSKKLSSLWS